MNSIKNFTYLDDYKMYSISSQIFEGMTEYIIKSTSDEIEEKTEQKGKFNSGQVMADLLVKQKNETQKLLLHDYSYNLFENKLISDGKVLMIDEKNFANSLQNIHKYNFVKVTGRVIFNDTKQIEHIISSFNDLGLAFTYVSNNASLEEVEKLKDSLETFQDKNQKVKAVNLVKNHLAEFKKLARESGLRMNEDFLKNLIYLIQYGYGGQFEIQVPFEDKTHNIYFSALIKREKLKENESLIIRKHGRTSEKLFTIFGILTQVQPEQTELQLFKNIEDKNMKETVVSIVSAMANMENVFTGKLSNEYVIDPIAIYNEI